mmetsp:Transcript_1326/g.4108  ORF Transcript_1326/g.4108 Transcript_1326/m.4108 type:complete len:177 (+) Transcript_1326:1507-2037(+)
MGFHETCPVIFTFPSRQLGSMYHCTLSKARCITRSRLEHSRRLRPILNLEHQLRVTLHQSAAVYASCPMEAKETLECHLWTPFMQCPSTPFQCRTPCTQTPTLLTRLPLRRQTSIPWAPVFLRKGMHPTDIQLLYRIHTTCSLLHNSNTISNPTSIIIIISSSSSSNNNNGKVCSP